MNNSNRVFLRQLMQPLTNANDSAWHEIVAGHAPVITFIDADDNWSFVFGLAVHVLQRMVSCDQPHMNLARSIANLLVKEEKVAAAARSLVGRALLTVLVACGQALQANSNGEMAVEILEQLTNWQCKTSNERTILTTSTLNDSSDLDFTKEAAFLQLLLAQQANTTTSPTKKQPVRGRAAAAGESIYAHYTALLDATDAIAMDGRLAWRRWTSVAATWYLRVPHLLAKYSSSPSASSATRALVLATTWSATTTSRAPSGGVDVYLKALGCTQQTCVDANHACVLFLRRALDTHDAALDPDPLEALARASDGMRCVAAVLIVQRQAREQHQQQALEPEQALQQQQQHCDAVLLQWAIRQFVACFKGEKTNDTSNYQLTEPLSEPSLPKEASKKRKTTADASDPWWTIDNNQTNKLSLFLRAMHASGQQQPNVFAAFVSLLVTVTEQCYKAVAVNKPTKRKRKRNARVETNERRWVVRKRVGFV
jgi:hypothetical protein